MKIRMKVEMFFSSDVYFSSGLHYFIIMVVGILMVGLIGIRNLGF